jgi:hypothetical protein
MMNYSKAAKERQIFLSEKGFYSGAIDGLFGKQSKEAERLYLLSVGEIKDNDKLSLKPARIQHTHNIAKLIIWAFENGYELAGKDRHSAREDGRHMKGSQHEKSLADDLDLYLDGVYQTSTAAHKALGEHWESLDPHCRWGGRYNDGNHYETLQRLWR